MPRSTNEIIIAVQECQPVTEEELKLALMVEKNINHFYRKALQDIVAASKGPAVTLGLRIGFLEGEKGLLESMFRAGKKPPEEWLSPRDIPGHPDQVAALRAGKALFKKATGLDMDDPRSFEEQEKDRPK